MSTAAAASATGTSTKPRRERKKPEPPSAAKCLDRLKSYTTVDKPGLSKTLLTDVAKYGDQAAKMVSALIEDGCYSLEVAIELSILTLYDLVVLIDDSSSMKLEDNQKRIETLRKTLEQITKIYSLANPDGIKSVRFLNHRQGKGMVKNDADVAVVIERCAFTGLTMIGTELRKKILTPFVLNDKPMTKPLLVMIITDGQVEGERDGLLVNVILDCIAQLKKRDDRGQDAVAFHFSKVGEDEGAKELLDGLDDHEKIGDHIDCLPDDMPLEDIADEAVWKEKKWDVLPKLLLGAILPWMDAKDKDLDLAEKGDDLSTGANVDDVLEDD